jgi:hypothetical protein
MTLLASVGPPVGGAAAKMQMLAVFEAIFLLFIGGLCY